ncbi:oxidoreductase [Leifsonia sp. Root227]|uniref:Gfo/Idh/MocA family protein n=1 Tax=Leifsonia sp. Root227 TaxID=1736496 RepID=UPI0006FFC6FA|nr:Gfo/Idh/MocA family oxidoreductase [Leifsonia sp. Root227]KRC52358.1 oxidoreductase [Leifsonia sp. Root227]
MALTVEMKTRTLRTAFVGGGFMAAVHSRAARAAGATIAGVASSTAEGAERAATAIGADRSYASVDDLLAADVDVVHICTPNSTHAEFALAALAAGKHVVCEKPLATGLGQALLLADRAEAGSLVATVPFAYRFHPMVREARARVAAGRLGRILTIQGHYLQDWLSSSSDSDWRVDARLGGPSRAFADIGSHLVDLVEFVAGERITRLEAMTRTVHAEREGIANVATEDLAALLVELDGGAVGTLLVSQVAPGRKNSLVIELSGDLESLRFDQESPETVWLGRTDRSSVLHRDASTLSPDAARLSLVPSGHPMGYQDAFNAFVSDTYRAIAGEFPEGLPTFRDGARAVRLTEAVLASAAGGGWQDVSAEAVAVPA